MTIDRILAWFPLLTLAAMYAVRCVRAATLRRRGVRVLVIDLRRPLRQILYDTLVLLVFLFWLYLVVAEAWPLSLGWLPDRLSIKLLDALPVRLLGAALLLAAPVLYDVALRWMGPSWRIGIDHRRPGPLVTNGLFGWTRNPVYTAFDTMFIGTLLVFGRTIYLVLGTALVLLIHGIIVREERFLTQRYGDAFRAYRQRVARYGLF